MRIRNELVKIATSAGGSFKTVNDRQNIAIRIAELLKGNNVQITTIEHLKSKHIEDYISLRLASGMTKRTIQNEMAAIRVILRVANRIDLADSKRISNSSLGISGASRKGTHKAMPDDMFESLIKTLEQENRGVMACVLLERHLGLRGEEAVQSCKSLKTWKKQLELGDRVRVIFGTKGGKARDTRVVSVEKALAAVDFGLDCIRESNGRLIDKPNLKVAMHRYSNLLRKTGCKGEFSPHSLRYAFVVDRVDKYLEEGYSSEESFAMTSLDIGHGDGRGRYVKQIYYQR